MEFCNLLNQYMEKLDCTAREFAQATGLSPASLSRYRAGDRVPSGDQIQKIMDGILSLAQARGICDIQAETVKTDFEGFLEETAFDYGKFTAKLNTLLSTLDISVSELSRTLHFDPSYLSRIRQGQRRPSDRDGFISGVCQYVVRQRSPESIAGLIGCCAKAIDSESTCFAALCQWLGSGRVETPDYMGGFLKKLDEFDLNEYIRAIHFDELKVPSVPFQLPTSKTYFGLDAMKQGELDFFKTTVLSKSAEPVFMCSDMPMEDMAKDLEFGKKWMYAIAMTLKKGLHLNIIHNVDRPMQEMMLGLESWIPIYMTGQVSPYYLKGKHNSVYCHLHYVSGQAALTGECIQGHHSEGRYYLTNNKEEVASSRQYARRLLDKANPLMDIFGSSEENRYRAFLDADSKVEGTRRGVLSTLPIYTIPEELLGSILKRHGVPDADSARILAFTRNQKALVETILEHDRVIDDVFLPSREEFEAHPLVLSLSGAFYEKELCYTYDEYCHHLEAAKEFEQSHPGYTLKTSPTHAFRNVQIQIHEGKWVIPQNPAGIVRRLLSGHLRHHEAEYDCLFAGKRPLFPKGFHWELLRKRSDICGGKRKPGNAVLGENHP